MVNEGAVGGGGEDGDAEAAREEEAGEVEEWDGVAFGHEGEQNHVALILHMLRINRTPHLSLLMIFFFLVK